MTLYTSKVVAQWLCLTERRVRQLRDEGVIVEARPGLYELQPTVARYMLSPLSTVNLTLRAAQQVYDKTGGYNFKGLRVVEIGRVKSFNPGKVEKGEAMEATITLELTYIMIEVDGVQLLEVDKLNGIYKVNGNDMLAGVNSLV